MNKNFDECNVVKKTLDDKHRTPTFKQREVWWCSVGLNVGHEENGKNEFFNRPVLVVRKFNNQIFLGVPLSTKIKDNKFYHPIHLKGKSGSVLLSQIRVWDSKRLTHKVGDITQDQFDLVRRKVIELI